MRILFIAPFGFSRKQTTGRRALPLGQALAAQGHEVLLLAPVWDCPGEAGKRWQAGGVEIQTPALGPFPVRTADPFLQRRMVRAAEVFQPDIVHVFKGLGYAGWTANHLQRRGAAPIVLDIDDLESALGWGASRTPVIRWWAIRQERHLLRAAEAVTVASAALRVAAGRVRDWRDEVLYLPNGLTPAAEPAPVADNPPVMLLYTRGNDIDWRRVAAVWRLVRQKAPEARLRIVGDWRDAPDLPASENLGWLAGERLETALRTAAVALFPVTDDARTRAKSPARLLDCLAQGLPMITERVGEYGLLAAGGGVVVEQGDDEALAVAASRLLLSPETRGEAGRAAWQRGRQHLWTLRGEEVAVLYARLAMKAP